MPKDTFTGLFASCFGADDPPQPANDNVSTTAMMDARTRETHFFICFILLFSSPAFRFLTGNMYLSVLYPK